MAKKDIPAVYSIMGMDDVKFKKYESLLPKNDYDHEQAETLAEAMTELVAINKRKQYLEELLHSNRKLQKFLWTSVDGRVQALHAIEDAHFRNILQLLVLKGRPISRAVRAEAASRQIDIPENYTSDNEAVIIPEIPFPF